MSELFAPKRTGVARWLPWMLGGAVILIAVLFPFLVDRPRFWLPNIGVRTIWLGIIAMSLVFLNRYVGLLSLAQVTVAGVSAYGVGVMMVTYEQPFLLAALVGLVAGTLAGFLIALIAARTKAIYFLMITLAIGQVFYSWASQAIEVTNARRGLAPVLKPDFGFVNLNDITSFYYFVLVIGILCYVLCRYAASSTFGLTLQGVRDSPDRMRALGYNVNRYRIAATTFAAFIASVGGVVLVLDRAQVDPDVVSLGSTLDVLVVAVIGGVGSLGGVFAGALVLTLLSNFAQNLTDRYMTLTGLVFIIVLLFAPAGLAGIGKQVKGFIARRRTPRHDAPQQDPSADQSAEHAITEGKQQ
ncbi:branched-chain amino acid ABC transporter permease [Schumannella luteola]